MPIDPTLIPANLDLSASFNLHDEDFVDFGLVQQIGTAPPDYQFWYVDLGFPKGDPGEHTVPAQFVIPVTGSVFFPVDMTLSPFVGFGIGIDVEFLGYTNDQYSDLIANRDILAHMQHAPVEWGTPHTSGIDGFGGGELTLYDDSVNPTWTIKFNVDLTGPPTIAGLKWHTSDGGSVSMTLAINTWITKHLGKTATYSGVLKLPCRVQGDFFAFGDQGQPAGGTINWWRYLTPPAGHDSFIVTTFQHVGKTYYNVRGVFITSPRDPYPPIGYYPPNGFKYFDTRNYKCTIVDAAVYWGVPAHTDKVAGNPWILEDDQGRLHRVVAEKLNDFTNGGVWYNRSDWAKGSGSWGVEDGVLVVNPGYNPRMIRDGRGRLYLTYSIRVGGTDDDQIHEIHEVCSDDDGATWSDTVVAIPNGKHPTISIGYDDGIVRAAFVDGNINATYQNAGDDKPSDVFPFVDKDNNPLAVADDTFHLMQAKRASREWLLSVIMDGDISVTDWWSGDDCRTWTKVQ